jgi:uncharacterized damage-inducible protein DinB
MSTSTPTQAAAVSASSLLNHWQGHRRLTRRLIESFPEDQLFTFSVGGMRPFGQLALEMLAMTTPMVRGVATAKWDAFAAGESGTKADVLRLWDESTEQLNEWWPRIPAERFDETMKAFGQYEGKVSDLLLYVIDNEIHHRGQGYVYLRALGINPPPFYERS